MQKPVKSRKIGVFGGSFNPIHNGHIAAALGMAKLLALDFVLIIPNALPPHKSAEFQTTAKHRLNMCAAACEKYHNLKVCDWEINQGGESYTYNTLEYLSNKYPKDKLYLLCGTDMFLTLLSWKKSRRIFELAVMCMAPRGDYDKSLYDAYSAKIQESGGSTILCELPKIHISSTMIREAIKQGSSISDFVPSKVEEYIYRHKLYREKDF